MISAFGVVHIYKADHYKRDDKGRFATIKGTCHKCGTGVTATIKDGKLQGKYLHTDHALARARGFDPHPVLAHKVGNRSYAHDPEMDEDEFELWADHAHGEQKKLYYAEGDEKSWKHNRKELVALADHLDSIGGGQIADDIWITIESSEPEHKRKLAGKGPTPGIREFVHRGRS
jgi:ribosomal protein S27AE